MSQDPKLWSKRQEIPDAQILDVADQYETARKLLVSQPPFSGVLLPLINVASIAIELYLKCLSAKLIHTPDSSFPSGSIVSAASTKRGHKLEPLFTEISDTLKQNLENAFQAEHPYIVGLTFLDVLKKCEGAFSDSRYPFEQDKDISKYPLDELMFISRFLSDFVSKLVPEEYIEWQ